MMSSKMQDYADIKDRELKQVNDDFSFSQEMQTLSINEMWKEKTRTLDNSFCNL